MTADQMSAELNLAAALALLSSTALRGATPAKTDALRLHLRAICAAPGITVNLRSTATELLGLWESSYCHPASRPLDPHIAQVVGSGSRLPH